MKTAELIKMLKRLGAQLKRHGTNHDIWINPQNGKTTRIWRHPKEIPSGTLNQIFKDLGYK